MNRKRIFILAAAALSAALWTYACGDGTTEPPAPPPDPPRATTVTVSPATARLAALGATVQLRAEVRDQNGNVMAGAAVAWSGGDATVATVDGSGLVTAAANGTATITATAGSASGTATVTVAQEVGAVAVSPAEATIAALDDTLRLAAQALDANGHALADVEFEWESSDDAVATVDGSGLVTAVANGTATISATAGSASGTATVTVAQEVSTVTVSPAADTLLVGDTVRLSAEAADANGHAVADAEFTWSSSDTTVAVVDGSGLVTGVAAGSARVTVTATDPGGLSARQGVTVTVEASNQAPEAVGSLPGRTMTAGQTATVEVARYFSDPDGDPLTYAASTSSIAVAGVSMSGSSLTIAGVAAGSATVTVTATDPGGLSAEQSATVTVERLNQAPEAVGSIPDQTVPAGQTVTIDASLYFSDADGDALTYDATSTSTAVALASVSVRTLTIAGVAPGSATVTVTATDPGDLAATQNVNVTVGARSPDRDALVAFYEGTSGDFHWRIDTNWLSDQPLGTWYGVTTDADGRVIELGLPGNNVWGPIPREFVHLQKLKRLDLSDNRLNEALPAEIGDLRDLEELNLGENTFLGSGTAVPAALGKLDKLRLLDLSDTGFRDVIPRELGNLRSLTRLDFSAMIWMSGAIPPEFGQLGNLRHLNLAGSYRLSGALPRELLDVPLDFFHWHDTALCAPGDDEYRTWLRGIGSQRANGACGGMGGVICDSWDGWTLARFYYWTSGSHWNTDTNWLSDQPLDSWYGVTTANDGRVVELSLPNNGLQNDVQWLACLEDLKRLDLSANRLEGRLGSRIGDLLDLEYLDLSDNVRLGYTDAPWPHTGTANPIPAALGNLGRLQVLDLSGTRFGGVIPRELGNLRSVTRLDFSEMTWLDGSIPPEFGRLADLRELDVSDSGLDGALPQALTNVPLSLFHWDRTDLCSPDNQPFRAWLGGIADHQGGRPCG